MDKKNKKTTELEKIQSSLKGQEIIKFIAKTLPHQPGVYQMEDEEGQILYIGKAKNLAKRVINYTSLNNLTRRLQRMVSLTKKMNFFQKINYILSVFDIVCVQLESFST